MTENDRRKSCFGNFEKQREAILCKTKDAYNTLKIYILLNFIFMTLRNYKENNREEE